MGYCLAIHHTVRALCVAQREWHEGMISDLFETKANFNRQRSHQKTVYNGRSAFMRARGLNAVAVKPLWDALPQVDKDWWSDEGRRMTIEADDLYSFGITCFILMGHLTRIVIYSNPRATGDYSASIVIFA